MNRRIFSILAAVALAVTALVSMPVTTSAHSTSCSSGSGVVYIKLWEHENRTGAVDDFCVNSTLAGTYDDDEFDQGVGGVDDIGDQANMHDNATAWTLVNNASHCEADFYIYSGEYQTGSIILQRTNRGGTFGPYHDDNTFGILENDKADSARIVLSGCGS